MGHRRSRGSARSFGAHRRLPFLAGTAAAAAIGFSVLTPSVHADAAPDAVANRQAALILAASAEQPAAGGTVAPVTSPRAASAVAQDQARAQALASAAARPAAGTPDAAPAPTFPATSDGYRAYAKSKVGATQFACLDPLWTRESHWNPAAHNPSSTAYGIAQLLDSTWSYTGVRKSPDGFRQVDAGLAYLHEAYPGGPCGAWAHEEAHGWY